MTSLTLKNISKSFGADIILNDVSLSIQDNMRLGIVGKNGAGKTTLLRIVCGELSSDAGTVSMPQGIRPGYLRQEVEGGGDATVWETMLAVFDQALSLEKRMRALEHDMEDASADKAKWHSMSHEYERVTKAFEEAGGYGYKSAIGGVLKGLGLGEDVYGRAVGTLSGGQKSRLMLARLLLERPGLLLLDEPTNHLDTDATQWLESYLKTWRGAVIIVSHDRWFLDQLCTHVGELSRGAIDICAGNYTAFAMKRQEKRRLQEKAFEHNQREISRQKKVVEQYYAWGRSGGGKNFIKAKARERMLEKMERVDRPESEGRAMSLRLNAARRGGNDVLMAENLAMAFDGPLFSGLYLHLVKGDRAALVGPNGIGKTTLLKIIASRLKPTDGKVILGKDVEISYYDQLQETLGRDNTVLEEMRGAFPNLTDGELRRSLAAFLFCGDDVFKKVSALSGGEKGRLSLLKMMMGQGNLLLLDEPTNHLDMDSREALEDALCDFDGTVLFVSHDRYFINKIACRVLEMKGQSLTQYDGNWSDYIAQLEKQKTAQPDADTGLTKTAAAKQKRAEKEQEERRKEAKKRVAELEAEIMLMETRLAEIESQLADPSALDEKALCAFSEEHESVRRQIDEAMQAWEEAHTMA
ncbi:MAG: ABC-F family ATP-binding cassette domain-containing protein [Eubacteriales bacterium]|nr:ABC-F family ATP-binding cassette domain-containing protein [Eubacteriales bacterium]